MGVKLLATGLTGRLVVTDQLNFICKHKHFVIFSTQNAPK